MNIATHRLSSQRLVGTPLDGAADVVGWLGAVQAQDYHGAKWGIAQRTREVDDAGLDRLFDEGAILRTHAMRPTWHFVAPADLRWLLALTSPRVHAANASRYRQLELDGDVLRRGSDLLARALRDGRYLTRQEIAGVLEAAGIDVTGQRLAYLVMYAELEGLVCSGPLRGRQFTYALLDERVPPAPALPREQSLAELTRRYFASHGPATAQDFSWWSGLTVADAKRGLEMVRPDLEPVEIGGRTYWTSASAAPAELREPVVHLLPNYDEHVVAYRDHGPSCHPAAAGRLHVRGEGGLDAHLVVLNGLIVGGWRRAVQRSDAVARARLLVELSGAERQALRRAVQDYGRFLGRAVHWEEQD